MKTFHSIKSTFIILFLVGAFGFSPPAYSETYIGFGVGTTIPNDFSNIKLGGAATASYDDLNVHNSFAYELKLGHFWDDFELKGFKFGLEFNYLNRDLDATTKFIGSTFPNQEHLGFRINTFHTLTLIPLARYAFGNFEPHFGVGLAVNLIDAEEISLGNTTINTIKVDHGLSDYVDVGMVLSVGLDYKVSEKLKFYSEYKHSTSSYDLFLVRGANTNFNLAFDTADNNFMAGFKYNFKLFE
ncbi:MAG: outer membrane beta-barrel protein [Nitrospinae bacterium]|nr:outer membrane beta-barrel protein [Nitrospinota bacterium]